MTETPETGISPEVRLNIMVNTGTELLVRELVEASGMPEADVIAMISDYLKQKAA